MTAFKEWLKQRQRLRDEARDGETSKKDRLVAAYKAGICDGGGCLLSDLDLEKVKRAFERWYE